MGIWSGIPDHGRSVGNSQPWSRIPDQSHEFATTRTDVLHQDYFFFFWSGFPGRDFPTTAGNSQPRSPEIPDHGREFPTTRTDFLHQDKFLLLVGISRPRSGIPNHGRREFPTTVGNSRPHELIFAPKSFFLLVGNSQPLTREFPTTVGNSQPRSGIIGR